MKEEKRIVYLDYLRVIATFFVIILHISGQNFNNIGIRTLEFHAINIYDSLSRFTVPIFVMISGALFLNSTKKITLKKLYSKNILRLVTAFIFWSLLYTLSMYIITPKGIQSFILDFITGYYHLWFIYMLMGLYILTPLLRKITESKDTMEYFLIIGFIVNFIIPFIFKIPKLSYFNSIYNSIGLKMVYGYSFYYVLGYYLFKHEMKEKNQKIVYALGILGALATIILTFILSNYYNKAIPLFYDNFSITIFFQCLALFTFAKYKLNNYKLEKVINISKYCFGIYLVHALIINVLNVLNMNSLTFNTFISIPIISIIVFIVSFIISYIINKIPFINKYIV